MIVHSILFNISSMNSLITCFPSMYEDFIIYIDQLQIHCNMSFQAILYMEPNDFIQNFQSLFTEISPPIWTSIDANGSMRESYGTEIIWRIRLYVIMVSSFFIFRPFFIWEWKIFISNGFFLQILPSTKFIFNFKDVTHKIQLT